MYVEYEGAGASKPKTKGELTMKKMTFAAMKRNDKASGHHWFSKATMEWWNTRLIDSPDKWNMFTYSNQYDPNRGTPLIYLVAIHIPANGKTFTVCPTEGFLSVGEARDYRTAVSKAFDTAQARELDIIENMVIADHLSSGTARFQRKDEGKEFEVIISESRIVG